MTFAAAAPRRPWWSPPAVPAAGGSGAVSLATPPVAPSAPRRTLFQGRTAQTIGPSFETTILVHLDAAYSLARFLTRDGDAAEDVVQEAVLKAYRGFGGFRGGDAKAWLLTIVRREFIDWSNTRRASRAAFVEMDPQIVEETVGGEDESPETLLLRQGEIGAVRHAIEGLPEPFREAIVLRELEEMSYRQVADVTGVPIGTVMSRLSRARKLLAQRLDPSSIAAPVREAGR